MDIHLISRGLKTNMKSIQRKSGMNEPSTEDQPHKMPEASLLDLYFLLAAMLMVTVKINQSVTTRLFRLHHEHSISTPQANTRLSFISPRIIVLEYPSSVRNWRITAQSNPHAYSLDIPSFRRMPEDMYDSKLAAPETSARRLPVSIVLIYLSQRC